MTETVMNDMLTDIYNALMANNELKTLVTGTKGIRVTYYIYDDTRDQTGLHLIIAPVMPPTPAVGGSDKELSVELTYQIDAVSANRKDVKRAQFLIKQIMSAMGFSQLPDGLDELLENKTYVDARRYRMNTKLYQTNY